MGLVHRDADVEPQVHSAFEPDLFPIKCMALAHLFDFSKAQFPHLL